LPSQLENLTEVRAKKAAYMREWYARNREKVREWNIRYRTRGPLSDDERKISRLPTTVAERSRRYRKEHAGEIAERALRYREEHRAVIAQHKRLHRLANIDAYRDRERRSYVTNREKRAATDRAWRVANPEARATYRQRRRARTKGAGQITLTRCEWEAIKVAFDYCCAYCGLRPARLEQDHVIPLARGGQHTSDNVAPACMTCNRRKYTRLDWRAPLLGAVV
jgi:5-methylcytosine-specific restriction endonuclease McrA